jgi:hypothetical protein
LYWSNQRSAFFSPSIVNQLLYFYPCISCVLTLFAFRHFRFTIGTHTYTHTQNNDVELLQVLKEVNMALVEQAQQLPKCPYRTNVTIVAKFRLGLLAERRNVKQVVCQLGTLPELIQQGRVELKRMEQRLVLESSAATSADAAAKQHP